MKMMVEITPKEITASKGSEAVKEKEALWLDETEEADSVRYEREIAKTKGRSNGDEEGQTYADKHV